MDIYFCEYGMIKVQKELNLITKKVGMGKNEEKTSDYRIRYQITVSFATMGDSRRIIVANEKRDRDGF